MPLKNWSTTASSNSSLPPNGAPEGGTSLANVNNIMRQIMADVRTLASSNTIASATTCDLGSLDETFLTVTGTTTITGFGTVSAGIYKFVTFSGALTLTHNATSLILLGGVSRTTDAGACGLYKSEGAGNWKEYFYNPAGGYQPLDAQLTTLAALTASQTSVLTGVADGTIGAFSHRNKIINGGFSVNQRVYVSAAATTVGQYTLDRWKVTATNGITFSTTANKTTVTIPAGQTIQQVVEGLNLQTGTYVLSWEGTAQGKIGAGSYSASGVTGSITGGTDTTIEFNTGTVANVQLEFGSVATPFEQRHIGVELILCQRYYRKGVSYFSTSVYDTGLAQAELCDFNVNMRVVPTVAVVPFDAISVGFTSFAATGATTYNFRYTFNTTASIGQTGTINLSWDASAEL